MGFTEAQVALLAVCFTFAPISIAATILRVWSIRLRQRAFKLHDYLIFGAEVFCLGQLGNTVSGVWVGGLGQYVQYTTVEQQITLDKMFGSAGYLWLLATSLAKLSVLMLLTDMFSQSRTFRWGAYGMAVIIVLFTVAVILSFSLHCRPYAYNWNKTIPGGVCGNVADEVKATAGANLGIDVLLFLLPMPTLWSLQMDRRRKLLVSSIFGVGLLVCIINVLRIVASVSPEGADFTYAATKESIYAFLESDLSVIVANLATLRPVFVKIRKDLANRTFWGSRKSRVGALTSSSGKWSAQGNNTSWQHPEFVRLDRDYELDVVGYTANAQASMTASIPDHAKEGEDYYANAITVKREMEVFKTQLVKGNAGLSGSV